MTSPSSDTAPSAPLKLADAGFRVAILERSTSPLELPGAVGLDGESVRAFQRIGLGDEVAALCQPPREKDELVSTDSHRWPLFGTILPRVGPHGWRDMAFFDQPELEAFFLRETVARNDRIDVFLGHEVIALDQDDREVVIECETAKGAKQEHHAFFAIGSDGASRFVRREIGAGWESLGYDQDWLVVDVMQGPEADLSLVTMQVCDPARLTTYVCVKDPNRRWEFQLVEGETREEMLRPQ